MDTVPTSVKGVISQLPESSSPQQDMWREVLARAILDALGYPSLVPAGQEEATIKSAVSYFSTSHQDLKSVMEYAGLDIPVAEFRQIMLEAIMEGEPQP